MSDIHSIGKRSAFYLAGNILSSVILFFLLPLHTAFLSPGEYGSYDLALTYIYLTISVVFIDIHQVVLRFLVAAKGTTADEESVLCSSVPILAGSTILYIGVMFLLNSLISFPFFPFVLVFGLLNKAVDFYGSVARSRGKAVHFAVSGMLYAVVSLLLTLLFLVVFRMGIHALFIAGIGGFLVQIAFFERDVRFLGRFRRKKLDFSITRRMFSYAVPFCINVTAYWILNRYSRIAISKILSVADNGLYASAMGVAAIFTLIARNFLLSWQEAAYALDGERNDRQRYFSGAADTFINVLAGLFVIMLPVVWFLFPLLIGAAYRIAMFYIPLALVGVLFCSFDQFLASMYGNIFENKIVILSTVLGAVLCLLLIGPMVQRFGVNGASAAVSSGFALSAAIKGFFLGRKIGLKIKAVPAIIAIGCIALSCTAFFTGSPFMIAASAVVLPGVIAFMLRKRLSGLWRRISGRLNSGR